MAVREIERSKPWKQPGIGASVCDINGRFLVRLNRDGVVDPGQRIAAISVTLPDGPYRIRVNSKAFGTYERVVYVQSGLQAQVFAIRNSVGFRGQRRRMTDLVGASIQYAPISEGFLADPDPESATQVAEAVVAALTASRPTVPEMLLRESLYFKFGNPLLGLMGGYLALFQKEPDRALMEQVAHGLTSMVPDWPDLLALRRWLGLDTGVPIGLPPMLRRSWDLVLEKATTDTRVVPPGSMLSQVAPRVLASSPWMTWQYAPEMVTQTGGNAEGRLPEVVRRLKLRPRGDTPMKQAPLQQYLEQSIDFSDEDEQDVSIEEVARNMNLPLSSVDQMVSELAEELESED
ncbi:MAG TPA: hypothetical protein PKA27_00460 [Fimbriimonadaceae bacterium]|nr:hypothetical protein [Fimbriimonadaceae bacterium]